MGGSERNERRGMLTGGLIVTGVGVIFLLHNLGFIPGFDIIWPLFPIIVGVVLIISALSGGRSSSGT